MCGFFNYHSSNLNFFQSDGDEENYKKVIETIKSSKNVDISYI